MSWHGLPLRWTTQIIQWNPPHSFEDIQLSGPYRSWHHIHRFEETNGGTQLTDIVHYAMPFGPLGWFAHAFTVRRDVGQIFDYRSDKIGTVL